MCYLLLATDNLQSNGMPADGIKKKLVKSVAGLSIAASVAVFSIIGVQQYNLLQVEENSGTVNLVSIAPALVANNPVTNNPITNEKTLAIISKQDASPVYVRVSGTRWNHERPQVGSRLNSYLVNHNEYTSATNLQGLVNYSRIAGYDVKK